jgi:hypothetical protein
MPITETDEMTTIQLTKGTRECLKAIGKKGETYEEIILRLLMSYDKNEKKAKRDEI